MATTNTPVPIRTGQPSSLDPIIDISKFLAGQKTTQTTAGQTAPLEAILAQMTAPGNLEALVANLFQQGAAQVPALTSQFAGATGTRVSNNTMLAQSLAALNQSIAQAIAQSVVQQQSAAAGAAGKLAEANKTSRTTQGPGSLMRAAIPTLVGTGLNKLGKIMDAGKAPIDPSIAAVPAFSEFQAGAFEVPELGLVPQDVGAIGAAGLPGIDVGAFDISNFVDFGAGGGETFDFGPTETFDDFFGGDSDFYSAEDLSGLFLRDGGQPRVVRKYRPEPNRYADGGQPQSRSQLRNRPQFGPRIAPIRTPALSFRGSMPVPRRRTQEDVETFEQAEFPGQSTVSPTAGVPGVNPGVSPFGSMNPSTLGLGALQAISLLSAPINVIMEALISKAIVHQVKSLLTPVVEPPMPPAIPISDAGIAMPAAEVPSFGETFGFESSESMGAFGTGEESGFSSVGDSGDSGGIGGSTGATSGPGGPGDGGDGAGGVWKDGGIVKGKRKGLVKGVGTSTSDSISAKVSVDEYILPADTVAALGKDLLDSIVASTHTPVGGGTRG